MKYVVPLALVCVLLLSGCMGNAVTISGQGYASGTQTKTISCGTEAHLAFGVQGAGKLTLTVEDGAGDHVYHNGNVGAGQDGQSQTLQGEAGEWTLKVSRGLGYAGQYSITLSC